MLICPSLVPTPNKYMTWTKQIVSKHVGIRIATDTQLERQFLNTYKDVRFWCYEQQRYRKPVLDKEIPSLQFWSARETLIVLSVINGECVEDSNWFESFALQVSFAVCDINNWVICWVFGVGTICGNVGLFKTRGRW